MENTGRDRIGSGEPTNGNRWVGGIASLVTFGFEIKIQLLGKYRTDKTCCKTDRNSRNNILQQPPKQVSTHVIKQCLHLFVSRPSVYRATIRSRLAIRKTIKERASAISCSRLLLSFRWMDRSIESSGGREGRSEYEVRKKGREERVEKHGLVKSCRPRLFPRYFAALNVN